MIYIYEFFLYLYNYFIELLGMFKNSVKAIGIIDESRKDAYLSHVIKVHGLKAILNKDFDHWPNFYSWESISVQQWIFSIALEVYKGKKIDIKCDYCEYSDFLPNDFEKIKEEKCFGKKNAYMIEKVLDEIASARIKRKSDGTYSS